MRTKMCLAKCIGGRLVTTGSIIHAAVTSGQPRSGHPDPLKFSTSSTSASASSSASALLSIISTRLVLPASFRCTLGHESCIGHCPMMIVQPTHLASKQWMYHRQVWPSIPCVDQLWGFNQCAISVIESLQCIHITYTHRIHMCVYTYQPPALD